MKDHIIKELSNKKVLILGFGREGRSTYNFIKGNNIDCIIGIADIMEILDNDLVKNKNIKLHLGEKYLDVLEEYDLIVKSPGISLKDINIENIKDRITSQTELFLKYAGHKTIGITGTKGKSTTASMIYSILKEQYNVALVGNIGLPAFEMMESYEQMQWYVYELSSHQLELVRHSPHISVFLNAYQEHLDYYKSYETYINAKKNIYKYQTNGDWYIYNHDMKEIIAEEKILQNYIGLTYQKDIQLNVATFDDESIIVNIGGKEKTVEIPRDLKNIIGEHNKYNLSAAVTIACVIGEKLENIESGIKKFKALPHRMEDIGTYKGVTYIDDSIATIPEATKRAIESIKDVDTVIIGGMDRGIQYLDFAKYLAKANVPNVILTYDSGKKIYEMMAQLEVKNNVIYVDDLEEAVEIAYKVTAKGKVCLLSPAAASYGVFKNFEHKGKRFKELVININLS